MIRSVVALNSRPLVCASRLRCTFIERTLQRRLFANVSATVGNGSDDYTNEERKSLLNVILTNDDMRNSMVYSLAMASLDKSSFPPLTRRLNEREKEQLRISQIQQRQFRSNSIRTIAAGEPDKEERRSKVNSEQRQQDREALLRTIAGDEEIHNSMAYSLAMAMDLEEPEVPLLTRAWTYDGKEGVLRRDQTRDDHRIANHDNMSSLVTDGVDVDVYDEDDILSMTYSRSFTSSPNKESKNFPPLTRSLNDRESDQLRKSKGQLTSKFTYPEQRRQNHPLPRTLKDALGRSSEAIVITETESPFRIFSVNAAWEGLCGYTHVESKGESLGTLLGGEETETSAITALIHQLFVHGEEATTVLTNYTKDGRKFRNRLSVGPLYDEETNEVSHYVGVLKEVSMQAD